MTDKPLLNANFINKMQQHKLLIINYKLLIINHLPPPEIELYFFQRNSSFFRKKTYFCS